MVVMSQPGGANSISAEAITEELGLLRRRYDETNADCIKLRQRLQTLRSRVDSFVSVDELDVNQTPDGAEILQLEQQIEIVMSDGRDAYCARKTYEQIIKRLKDESATYTRELAGLDQQTSAKEHDARMLQLMLKDATHVRDVARHELAKVNEAVAEERKQRQRSLQECIERRRQEKRRKLELRQNSAKAHERRCQARAAALLAEKEEAKERRTGEVTASSLEAEREQIALYEAQFAQVKEIVGVGSVGEIIDKFTSQEETHATLNSLTRESQRKIDQLLGAKSEAKKRLEDARYLEKSLGTVGGEAPKGPQRYSGRAQVHAEQQLALMRERQAHQRQRRVSSLLLEARVAIDHLEQVLGTTGLPDEILMAMASAVAAKRLGTDGEDPPPADDPEGTGDATVLDLTGALSRQVERLIQLHGYVVSKERELGLQPAVSEGEDTSALQLLSPTRHKALDGGEMVRDRAVVLEEADGLAFQLAPQQGPLLKAKAENLRIRDEQQEEEDDIEDEDDPDILSDPQVLDREAMKKHSHALLKKRTAGRSSKPPKKGKSDDEGS